MNDTTVPDDERGLSLGNLTTAAAALEPSKPDLTTTVFYKVFRIYLQLLIVIIGLIGNSLTIVVLRNGKSRHSSATPYLICLAVSDNIYLLSGIAMMPLMTFMGYKDLYIMTFHLSGCVIYLFVAYYSAQVSSWLITAVTIERVGVVVMPHKSKSLFTKKRSYFVILLIVIILFIENSHIFFAHELVTIDGEKACLIKEQFEYFSINIWPWLDAIMYNFLPFFIIIICNIIIISAVLKSVRNRQSMMAGTDDPKNDSETNRMTQMLLAISFFFIITTTPISMYLLFANPDDPDRISEKSLNYIVVNFVASLNHSCNFIMYSVSGPAFRADLFRIIFCKKNTETSSSVSSVS